MKFRKITLALCAGVLLLLGGNANAQQVDTLFYTGAIQNFTVPACVTQITIEAYGAQGGMTMGENNSGPWTGGLGAYIKGTFAVSGGQVLDILVGQAGSTAPGSSCTAGGGGGSWVVRSGTLLLVAGGGGGGFMCNALGGVNGNGGSAANNGDSGISACPCRLADAGGSGGNGGIGCYGGGGGGWLSAGSCSCGGIGGGMYPGAAVAGGGGYGGGGGAYNTGCCGGSGGGGGYSGGSSGQSDGCAGGGGGSYNTGLSQTDVPAVRSGDGLVIITYTSSVGISGNIISNVSCHGNSDGKASGIVAGGGAPFTYSWTPSGGTHDTASGLTAGTYTITVTDACSNSATASVTITQPSVLTLGASALTNVLCNGGNTGSVTCTPGGGTVPYSYLWTGGATTATVSGLSAGTYTINLTDNNGCTASASTTITQPSALNITPAFVNETSNAPCNGQASAGVIGGTSPYTYNWTGGGTTDTIKSLCSGSYCCHVTDHNGCIDSTCVTIMNLTGVNEVTSNSGPIMVYPNPSNGQFTIKTTVDCGASLVEIYNVLGEKISSTSLNAKGGNQTIDISSQPNGVYVYKVISKTGTLVGVGNISIQK